MNIPEFEFDPEKSQLNFIKHGIDFEEAQKLWIVPHFEIIIKPVRGEIRWALLGKLRGFVYAAVFTWRSRKVRLITCHRADKRLIKIYEKGPQEEKKS